MSQAHSHPNWPELTLAEWSDTRATLHMWLQIVGKIRLRLAPFVNHSWNTTLYVTARGLTTSPMPIAGQVLQIDLDFIDHRLIVAASTGGTGGFPLEAQSVAAFYARLMAELTRMGLPVRIWPAPNEVPDPMPFALDEAHCAYDPNAVSRYWRILVQADRVMKEFRGRFIGKCSPVHLFWGAMDHAVTRFSGAPAPQHPGGIPHLPDRVTREAYSHEVISCGFWPGTPPIDYPAFYAYAYPEPVGFAASHVRPEGAFYSTDFKEFILPYDRVRTAPSPDDALMEFLQSTYAAAADLAGWNRAALEHRPI